MAADRLNMTANQVVGFMAAVVNNSGGNVDDIVLSKSSAMRQRTSARTSQSRLIRENFDSSTGCQVNFDGKLMKDLNGHQLGKVNRLAVTLHRESGTKLLSIAKTDDSTGEGEASRINDILKDWGVNNNVLAMGFDTTSSNTGINKGACKILQATLGKQLLWMACRHHVLELLLTAAYNELFGATSGPEVALFKKLQDVWQELNLTDIILPDIPPNLEEQSTEILTFVETRLSDPSSLPRCDYKELLELTKLFLGGSISRKNGYKYRLQTPGAFHHARWMAKAIYILKMCLLQHQLSNIHHTKKKKLTKMALFIVFVYLKPWFTAHSLTSAATTDLQLFQSLVDYKKIDKSMSGSCIKVLQRHTWYLTEENIAFSLFNEALPLSQRNELARSILTTMKKGKIAIKKPELPTIKEKSRLPDFTGPRTRLLFDLLGVSPEFLNKRNWHLSDEYGLMKSALKMLSSTNDTAERAISLMSNYNTRITRTEESFQELLQVVEWHRENFSFKSKSKLRSFK